MPPRGRKARIASLAPSLTETLFAPGLREQIVARTGFCVHPRAEVRAIPKVSGTKNVRLDALRALQPTHVLVSIDENTRDMADTLRHFAPHILVTHAQTPQDNLHLFSLLGGAHAEEVRSLLAARGLHPEVRCIPGEWAMSYGVRAIDGLRQLAASARSRPG